MKKLVKESLNEIQSRSNIKHVDVDEVFYEVTEYFRRRIFPKLNDDDLHELALKLKSWFNENV